MVKIRIPDKLVVKLFKEQRFIVQPFLLWLKRLNFYNQYYKYRFQVVSKTFWRSQKSNNNL